MAKKVLTLEQSLSLILSKPVVSSKAKLNLAEVWPKIQPFLLMIATFIPKIAKYVNALIAAMEVIIAGGKAKIDLNVLWPKVRPFLLMAATLFGKKVSVYINAFIAAIDKLVEVEVEE